MPEYTVTVTPGQTNSEALHSQEAHIFMIDIAFLLRPH